MNIIGKSYRESGRAGFTLIERGKDFRFSILDFRFPNDQAIASSSQWRGSAQSKIENPESKISRAWRGRGRGFTLIELLTVIVIIGVLAAILIPVIGKVRESAASATTLGSLKQLYLGARMYANDNKGNLPAIYNTADNHWWGPMLCRGGYLGEATPSLRIYFASYKNPLVQRKQGEIIYNQLGCFGMNTSIPGPLVVNGSPLRTSIAIDRLAWPSRTVLFADANLKTNNAAEVALVDESTRYILGGNTAYPNTWSGGSAHYVFADGSAKKIKAQNPEEKNSPPAGLDKTVFFTITYN